MSEDELLGDPTLSKPVRKGKKPKTNLSEARIEKIRKEFNESRYKFFKSKITEKSSTTKINKHKASDYSLFTYCSFDTTKNKLDYYRGKNCMKNFFLDLREHAKKKLIMKRKKLYH